MLPITLANVQLFCRVCLRELVLPTPPYKPNHDIEKEDLRDLLENVAGVSTEHRKKYLFPNRICHSCYIKMIALDTFRQKCIINVGVFKLVMLENLQETAMIKLKTYCRICLKCANDGINMDENPELLANIEQCCGLQQKAADESESLLADDSRFPQKLCERCSSKLKTFMFFRSLAQQTDEYLKSLLDDDDRVEVKNEAVEPEILIMEQPKTTYFEQKSTAIETFSTRTNGVELDESDIKPIVKIEHCDIDIETEESVCMDAPLIPVFEVIKLEKNPLCDALQNEETVQDLSDVNMTTETSAATNSEADSITAKSPKENFKKLKRLITKKTEPERVKNIEKVTKSIRLVKDSKKHIRCSKCDRTFYKQLMLEAHIKNVHEGVERPFTCDLCSSSFRQYSALDRHRTLLHTPKEPIPTDVDVFAPPKANIHVCMTCLRQFKRKDSLEHHINTAHTDTELRPFKCKFCQKGFGSKRTMMRHEQNHSKERPFICEFCPKRYNTKAELSSHMQRHTTNPDLLCPICKRGKASAEELQKHIEMHEASRQHQCPICGRVFTKLFHLREHENAVHLKLRPFKCSYCEKTFATRRTQKEHEQLHDPTMRPVLCIFCTMNFKNESTLSRHMIKEHNQLPKKLRSKKNTNVEETVTNQKKSIIKS